MSAILQRIVNSETDKRVVLSNSELKRKMTFGTSWTKLSIGVRWAVRSNGFSLPEFPSFAVGVMRGTANGYGALSTDHWVGVRSANSAWNYNAGPPAYFSVPNSSLPLPTKRVGTTLTNPSGVNSSSTTYPGAPSLVRGVWIVRIYKGSPNYDIARFYPGTGVTTDVSYADFLGLMNTQIPSRTGYSLYTASGLVGVNEGVDGGLDSVSVYWGRGAVPVEISDVVVTRWS